MPVKLFRNLSLVHLEGSKFDYIEKECGITISGNHEMLTPVLADKQLACAMNIPEQTPLLRITTLSYNDNGDFLNYSVMFRNTSEYQVDYHLRRVQVDSPVMSASINIHKATDIPMVFPSVEDKP